MTTLIFALLGITLTADPTGIAKGEIDSGIAQSRSFCRQMLTRGSDRSAAIRYIRSIRYAGLRADTTDVP